MPKNFVKRSRRKKDTRLKIPPKNKFFQKGKINTSEIIDSERVQKLIEEKIIGRKRISYAKGKAPPDPPGSPRTMVKITSIRLTHPTITLNGMVYTNDSLSIVTRGLAVGFNKIGRKVSIDAWADGNKQLLVEKSVSKAIGRPTDRKIGIRISHPNSFSVLKGYGFKIGYGVCETEIIPDDWVSSCNRFCDQVWTPSTFCTDTFKRCGIQNVYTVPNGFSPEHFNRKIPPYHYNFPKDTFVFLTIGNAQERKGTDILYNAFKEEFSHGENVALVIKSYAPWAWGLSKYAGNEMILPEIALKHNVKLIKDPRVFGFGKVKEFFTKGKSELRLVDPNVPCTQIGGLYTGADCFVLPTKAEGFGLPILEAKACGLPVIATNWSGHLDFCDNKDTYLIEYTGFSKAFEKHDWQGHWVEPDPKHLRYLMRHVYEYRDLAKKKANIGYLKAHGGWTWEHAARKAVGYISLGKPDIWIEELA